MGTRYLIEPLVEEEIERKAQKMLYWRKKFKYFSGEEEETRENIEALYERLKIGKFQVLKLDLRVRAKVS